MIKFTKMVGVTLLEVMLVLAVAAMIIVMSIRYYQTATSNQQVNGGLQMMQAVIAAADGLAQGTGSYSASPAVTSANIKSLMPNELMRTPWGTTLGFVVGSASDFTMTFPSTPKAVCLQMVARLAASNKLSTTSTCTAATNTLAIKYNSLGS